MAKKTKTVSQASASQPEDNCEERRGDEKGKTSGAEIINDNCGNGGDCGNKSCSGSVERL